MRDCRGGGQFVCICEHVSLSGPFAYSDMGVHMLSGEANSVTVFCTHLRVSRVICAKAR